MTTPTPQDGTPQIPSDLPTELGLLLHRDNIVNHAANAYLKSQEQESEDTPLKDNNDD